MKYFRYLSHPGDLLRNTDIIPLPNPNEDLEEFLIWFLHGFQSDDRIAYMDDLYKLLQNEFTENSEKLKFIERVGEKTQKEAKDEIELIEEELKQESYRNFYHLVLDNKIEIIENND